MRSPDLRRATLRLRLVQGLMLVAFVGLAVRAGHLSVIETRGAQRGKGQKNRELQLPPYRGLIVDRNGAELALSIDAPSVYAVPAQLDDLEAATQQLARSLGLSASTVRSRLARSSGFSFVARWITEEQAERVRKLSLPGVGILDEPRHVYPYRDLAASIVGFSNIDGDGVRGIEQQEDGWLRGRSRRIPVERDNHGRLLLPSGVDPRATFGGDVLLSIDAVLQADAERALDEATQATDARGGIVVSLEPRTGEILAIADRPGFDPNRFREVDYVETRSRAFLDAFEPGSTLKAFLVAAALEAGAIRANQSIDCGEGSYRVPGKTIRDRRAFGVLDPAGVLRVSSNVGATLIAYRLGAQEHFEGLRRFGFGRATGTGFPDESSGLMRAWRDWRPVDHATIAFGQGVSVTAVQLAAATASLANRGQWRPPRLVSARRVGRGSWVPEPTKGTRRVVGDETAARVLEMMRGVVSPEGTGRLAALRDVPVAGKTGTAQKLDPGTGSYAPDRYLAWFVGVVPANDPRLVIVAMLDEPTGNAHTGGAAAAPLFARVAAAQLRSLGIVTEPGLPEVRVAELVPEEERMPEPKPAPRSAPSEPVAPSVSTPAPPTPEVAEKPAPKPSVVLASVGNRVLLPDFRGLTLEQVKSITAGSSLRVELLGNGRAVAQEPDPGTILAGTATRVRVRFTPEGG